VTRGCEHCRVSLSDACEVQILQHSSMEGLTSLCYVATPAPGLPVSGMKFAVWKSHTGLVLRSSVFG